MTSQKNQHNLEAKHVQTARVRVLLLAGGISLMLIGSYLSSATTAPGITGILQLLGIIPILFGVAIYTDHGLVAAVWKKVKHTARWLGITPWQLVLIYFGMALSLASRAAAGNDRMAQSEWHSVLWILGIGLVVVGCWRKDEATNYQGLDKQDYLLIGLFFLVALLLRSVFLDSQPYTLTGDEGETGLYGLQFVDGLRNNLLDTGWHGFPALYFWLVSISQRILGPTVTGIRVLSVIGGSLSVIAVYWTSKHMFNRTIAFFAAAFLTGMHFHILFSRVAVNNIWDGLFLSLMLGGIWVAWRHNLRWSFILAGAAVGLSQFFYTTGRLVPVYALLFIILLYLFNREKRRLPGLTVLGLVMVSIVLPFGLYCLDNWFEILSPIKSVSLLSPNIVENYMRTTGNSVLFLVGEQFWLTALGFVSEPLVGLYRPQTPMLNPISGILFITGFIIGLLRIREPRYAIVVIGLLGPVVAGALSVEAPNSQRLLFATPLVALLIGIALTEIVNLLQVAWPKQRSYVSIIPITILAVIIAQDINFFFSEAMLDHRYSDRGGLVAREVAEFLSEKPPGSEVVFFGPAEIGFNSIPSLPYLAPHVNGYDIFWPLEDDEELPEPSGNLILIFPPFSEDYYPEIRTHYADASVEVAYDQNHNILFRALTFEN